MTALLMTGPEPIGTALCQHSGRGPLRTSASLQARYGISWTPIDEAADVEARMRQARPVRQEDGISGLFRSRHASTSRTKPFGNAPFTPCVVYQRSDALPSLKPAFSRYAVDYLMPPTFLEEPRFQLPAPRWAVVAWLMAPMRSVGLEGDAELRQTMLRRLDAILVSAAVTVLVVIIAFIRHPTLPFGCWLCLDILLAAVRLPVVVLMLRLSSNANSGRLLPPWITDAFVCLGTLWSGLLGFGTLICVATGDPGLSVIAALLAMGTIGAQSARNPASPRLNSVQMCLVMLPFTAGSLLSVLPLMRWILLLAPMYLVGMLSITRQLHEDYLASLQARIENRDRALHCPLTGLPNRACFDESLKAALKRTAKYGRLLLIMFLDLDGFKAVNDEFGHAAGDALLVQVARRLQVWSRSESLAARLGGDEFAVLLSTDDSEQAELDAQELINSLRYPYNLGFSREICIGVSIGLASNAPGMDAATLTLEADMALYDAKRSGKGMFRWSGEAALLVDRRRPEPMSGEGRGATPPPGRQCVTARSR